MILTIHGGHQRKKVIEFLNFNYADSIDVFSLSTIDRLKHFTFLIFNFSSIIEKQLNIVTPYLVSFTLISISLKMYFSHDSIHVFL